MFIDTLKIITAIYLIEFYTIVGILTSIILHWIYVILLVYFICIPIFSGLFCNKFYKSEPHNHSNKYVGFICGLLWPITIPILLLCNIFGKLFKFGRILNK